MNKIIPFKKEIPFENSIYEIVSISLEHNLSLEGNNFIQGSFTVSGTYKMTSSSINIDDFSYNLPFEISIDKKYDTSNVTVDISDFFYEIIDNKTLSIDIEVIIDNLEEKEEKIMEEPIEEVQEIKEPEETEVRNDKEIESIFEVLDDNENYVTYKVHIVTENDTIESILQKYEIKENNLDLYNDLSDLKIGDKLIIPANDQIK